MIYGFLDDAAMYARSAIVMADDAVDVGMGYLDDDAINYFNSPATMRDPRAARLAMFANAAQGMMRVRFDNDKLDGADFTGVTNDEFTKLFNVIEYVALVQDKTVDAINSDLIADDANYGVYVDGTLTADVATTAISIALNDGTSEDNVEVRHWIAFTATLGGVAIEFKLWINTAAFLIDYPYTTIVKIIYPCAPEKLPTADFANVTTAMSEMSNYVDTILGTEVAGDDHSGIARFTTKYSTTGTNWQILTIGVLYKGKMPANGDLRTAVRDDLLSLNLTTEETWQQIFPDLFVGARFFLLPIWDEVYVTPEVTLYKGITSYKHIADVFAEVFPNYDTGAANTYGSLLRSAAKEVNIYAVPDEGNDPTDMSFAAIHPTYQAVDAQDPTYVYMAASTKEFCTYLSGCIAQIDGANNGVILNTEVINGFTFKTFTVNGVEFLVLNKLSFPDV